MNAYQSNKQSNIARMATWLVTDEKQGVSPRNLGSLSFKAKLFKQKKKLVAVAPFS